MGLKDDILSKFITFGSNSKLVSTKKHKYCRDCKYFEVFTTDFGSSHSCVHPTNKTVIHRYTGPEKKAQWAPGIKNENCDCDLWDR